MLFAQLADDKEEASAKKSLAVLTELYRRNVWTDARTVNVIASACFHTSHGLLIAALKFFLGQDAKSEQVRAIGIGFPSECHTGGCVARQAPRASSSVAPSSVPWAAPCSPPVLVQHSRRRTRPVTPLRWHPA